MPFVTVDCGKTDPETKARLIRELTRVTGETLAHDPKDILVLIRENHPDNIGIGGQTLTEVLAMK